MLRRLEFHYVPKHASWLNMVEIEIGVMAGRCLARPHSRPRDADVESDRVDHHAKCRGVAVTWMFGIEQARTKLGHAYPSSGAAAPNVAT